ncbi:protein NRT1/ PTR FAMILY 6.2-like [Phragmites australis]|uniref:protein NRT1/ PTR FAMILY 6.2-like n=1 Tax=Phragmites australis TaxID=29695 RepID=UPI002D7939E2|nr:protein NRT1/ PTR FAMILY 6.2-like [Phragmites australis]
MASEDGKKVHERSPWGGRDGGNLVQDAVDYRGCPADKSSTGGWVAAALTLGIELCERLSTMGIAVNLVTYLTGTMHLPSAVAANVVTDFMGTSFLLCLLGGFLADSFLGRYLTIAIFALVQAIGTGLLAVSTEVRQLRPPPCEGGAGAGPCEQATGLQMGVLYVCLYLIALGTGGLKSSVSGFGTDQFDERDARERAAMGLFFNRFFFFISVGTLLAVTVLVYVQDHVGRSWAYGICAGAMLAAIAVFLSGTRRYRYKRSSGSPIVHILQVLVAAARKRNIKQPLAAAALYEDLPGHARLPHTAQFPCLDRAAVMAGDGDNEVGHDGRPTPNPWKLCSVSRVEEVKMVARLMPVWATTILFWTIYAQMITFSVEQATTMDRRMGGFEIPAASLTVFFVGAIMLTLAIYDRVFIPLCRSLITGRQGFTNLEKVGIGLVLSIVGMAAAAISEKKRLTVAATNAGQGPLPISVVMLTPQFLLVGAGEAFIYTGQLDFFITRSPRGMKTMSTGLFLTTLSLGFFLSSALVSLVKSCTRWLGDTINHSRLDYFYWLLAVLSVVNLAAYLVCAMWAVPPATSQADQPQPATAADEKC